MVTNVLEKIPSFDVIASCTPIVRTGTTQFKHAVIRYSKELIRLIARRDNFNKDKAILAFKFENVSALAPIGLPL